MSIQIHPVVKAQSGAMTKEPTRNSAHLDVAGIGTRELVGFRDHFSDRVQATLRFLTEQASAQNLLTQFRTAFDYRAKLSWLGESGELVGRRNRNGLAYALRAALSTYHPTATDTRSLDHLVTVGIEPQWRRWLGEFQAAAVESVEDDLALTRFAIATADGESIDDIDLISDDRLRHHVIAALAQYVERHQSGTTPDPW